MNDYQRLLPYSSFLDCRLDQFQRVAMASDGFTVYYRQYNQAGTGWSENNQLSGINPSMQDCWRA